MSERLERLLDEFAVRFRRGERPNLREYLGQAGDEAEELARLVNAFLAAAPPPPVSEEAVALSRRWVEGESPVLALRVERHLKRDEVVDALLSRLGLEPQRREKLRLRYHELETGQLEPARVDRRVWDALAQTLHATVDELASWARPLRTQDAELAYYRLAGTQPPPERIYPEQSEAPDEVDRLFGVAG